MSEHDDKLLDHDYDGIRELDNDLPRWWVWLFILCIGWAFAYMIYYHVFGIGYLQADEYKREVDPNYVKADKGGHYPLGLFEPYRSPDYAPERDIVLHKDTGKKVQFVEERRENDTTTYLAYSDPKHISEGKEIFNTKCISCHGKFAEGNIGPNLTDDYWLHGEGIDNIVKTIKYGLPAKGMLSWRGELKIDQIQEVASYILSLHGSNPPNPKAPQGVLVADNQSKAL
jgi:cytochrome c oxidase cbb3-type subunit III